MMAFQGAKRGVAPEGCSSVFWCRIRNNWAKGPLACLSEPWLAGTGGGAMPGRQVLLAGYTVLSPEPAHMSVMETVSALGTCIWREQWPHTLN